MSFGTGGPMCRPAAVPGAAAQSNVSDAVLDGSATGDATGTAAPSRALTLLHAIIAARILVTYFPDELPDIETVAAAMFAGQMPVELQKKLAAHLLPRVEQKTRPSSPASGASE